MVDDTDAAGGQLSTLDEPTSLLLQVRATFSEGSVAPTAWFWPVGTCSNSASR
jgi:hypothetical protein